MASRPPQPADARTPAPAPPPALAPLLRERATIEPLRRALPMLCALLDAEIARAAAPDPALALSPLPPAPAPRKRVKLPVPADRFPEYNFVGRLLGPRGTTLKTLERDTGCKIMIRGKGSIRKDKEPDVRGKPGWEHVFNEPLHVVIEVGETLDDAAAARALNRAKEAVELLLVPVPEERDGLKRQQLRALAIMNGTYRGAHVPRPLDPALSMSPFSTSPGTQGLTSFLDDPSTSHGFLGDSVAATLTPSVPTFDFPVDEPAYRPGQFGRFNSYGPSSTRQPSRGSPDSGATSPQTHLFGAGTRSYPADIASKMRQCAVAVGADEFGSSSVGDDSPDSSRSSEDGEPSSQIVGVAFADPATSQPRLSPGNRSSSLGVGGFLGQEFYNGAFSNGPSPNPWDQPAPSSASPPFSASAVYGVSPVPSPQLLTTSSTTVTPLGRHSDY